MAVIRHGPAPEDHYSLVSNELARDPGISLQAKGIYLYLRSHREGWSMSTQRIGEALGINKDTVSKYVRELESVGFLVRSYSHSGKGTFDGMEYTILSEPLPKKPVNGVYRKRLEPEPVVTGAGSSGTHKKTNSYKKTSSSKKTKTPALDSNWKPTGEQWSKLKEKHEGKDIEAELEKFRDWHIEKKSQYKDWNRAFDNWLKRARPSRQQLPEVDYVAAYGLENAPF